MGSGLTTSSTTTAEAAHGDFCPNPARGRISLKTSGNTNTIATSGGDTQANAGVAAGAAISFNVANATAAPQLRAGDTAPPLRGCDERHDLAICQRPPLRGRGLDHRAPRGG
jgi:hypothetical protein